ncbi:hypothetical protein CJ030_MR6G010837 [Morella rubra]|uniref:Uncharacterized protein n=1 Tax=Morella rubra TaxID=262757 RepID=A0A6A1VCX8_9ROSI|nr:hypothetical protein CJ030_MR6G010837 [Morella rubra]
MDRRKVSTINFDHGRELKMKAKKCYRGQVLPPKRGRIKRRICSWFAQKLMKITNRPKHSQ